MFDSVKSKPYKEPEEDNFFPKGKYKATILDITVRQYEDQETGNYVDYLQILYSVDGKDLKQNFYLNSDDEKKRDKAANKLNKFLLAMGITPEVVEKGGFSAYDQFINKRVSLIINSFRNKKDNILITYIDKYEPLSNEDVPFDDEIPF